MNTKTNSKYFHYLSTCNFMWEGNKNICLDYLSTCYFMWEGNKNICLDYLSTCNFMWEGNKKFVFITFPHAISCGKVIKKSFLLPFHMTLHARR